MNKHELIDALAKTVKVSKAQASTLLNGFTEVVTKTLKKGQPIALTGFGTFKVVKRKARTGVNPQTGKSIKIPAKKAPKFQAGKSLKDAVR